MQFEDLQESYLQHRRASVAREAKRQTTGEAEEGLASGEASPAGPVESREGAGSGLQHFQQILSSFTRFRSVCYWGQSRGWTKHCAPSLWVHCLWTIPTCLSYARTVTVLVSFFQVAYSSPLLHLDLSRLLRCLAAASSCLLRQLTRSAFLCAVSFGPSVEPSAA